MQPRMIAHAAVLLAAVAAWPAAAQDAPEWNDVAVFKIGTEKPQDPRQPPHVPVDDNPVGSYRTRFTLPADWNGRRVFPHFAGVDSAFYVWVNGTRVGYSEGSRTPAEFDITPHVQRGENLLVMDETKHDRK